MQKEAKRGPQWTSGSTQILSLGNMNGYIAQDTTFEFISELRPAISNVLSPPDACGCCVSCLCQRQSTHSSRSLKFFPSTPTAERSKFLGWHQNCSTFPTWSPLPCRFKREAPTPTGFPSTVSSLPPLSTRSRRVQTRRGGLNYHQRGRELSGEYEIIMNVLSTL